MKSDFNNDIALLEIKALTYKIIGSAFLNLPDMDQIEAILQEELFTDFPLIIPTENYQTGLTLLRSWAHEITPDNKDDILAQLKEDYYRLFIGPAQLLAPPWESVYLSDDKLVFGPQTIQVREFYQRHGLKFKLKDSEPDDHFGLELQFMAELIRRQLEQLELGSHDKVLFLIEEQGSFLEQHLRKWASQFTNAVIDHANTNYYRGMAMLAIDLLTYA